MTYDIVLLGMPLCGKTTIGEALAKTLCVKFKDCDREIEKCTGKKPSEIILSDGEESFRKIESKVLKELLGKNRVIATGGGVVCRQENYDTIKANNTVTVYIKREISDIDNAELQKRPILKEKGLKKLYDERRELYERFSDITVDNAKTVDETVKMIIDKVKMYEDNCN